MNELKLLKLCPSRLRGWLLTNGSVQRNEKPNGVCCFKELLSCHGKLAVDALRLLREGESSASPPGPEDLCAAAPVSASTHVLAGPAGRPHRRVSLPQYPTCLRVLLGPAMATSLHVRNVPPTLHTSIPVSHSK